MKTVLPVCRNIVLRDRERESRTIPGALNRGGTIGERKVKDSGQVSGVICLCLKAKILGVVLNGELIGIWELYQSIISCRLGRQIYGWKGLRGRDGQLACCECNVVF